MEIQQLTPLLTPIISAFTQRFLQYSDAIFEGLKDEARQFLGKELKIYLANQCNRFAYIKTLLRGNTPVYLYDLYYPLKLDDGQGNTIETDNINNLFFKTNFITITGDAGSGKSTLVKHLFINSIENEVGIPILIELRYLNTYNNSLNEYIKSKIFQNNISQNDTILERLLKNGKFIFFLDGYDELNSDIKGKVVSEMQEFVNIYNNNRYILTTRPYSNIEHFPLFHNYSVQRLRKDDIGEFVYKQLLDEEELASKIISSVNNNKSEYIESFLTNPLLLSLYILTFQSYASIPSEKSVFYRRVINVLFSEHDSKTKIGYTRERLTKLNQQQFEDILKRFCFMSFFGEKFSWDTGYVSEILEKIKPKLNIPDFDNYQFIDDLKTAIALWIEDNGQLSFAHRSLQEYFTVLAAKSFQEEQSRVFYKKLNIRYRQLSKIENFLSLCEEMDTINFKKHFRLQILKSLRNAIHDNDEVNLGKKFLAYFVEVFYFTFDSINETILPIIGHNSKIQVIDYLIDHFIQNLTNYLFKLTRTEKFSQYSFNIKKNGSIELGIEKTATGYYGIRFEKGNIPKHFWELCKDDIIPLATEFLRFVEKSIEEDERYIANENSSVQELVDLL